MKKSIVHALWLPLLMCAHSVLKAADIWNPGTTIIPGQPAFSGEYPQIAFDHNGNAIAVWQQNDGGNQQIYYARYNATTTLWSDATIIPGQPTQSGSNPQIAFDNIGNAIAVWNQWTSSYYEIYYARYDVNTTAWSNAATIPGQPTQSGSNPQIAFDNIGNAIAVWQQADDSSTTQIYYARYDANTTAWSNATKIPGQPAQYGSNPQIAFDNNGNAIAVWQQSNGGNDQIYYARYDANTTLWSIPATLIPAPPAGSWGVYPQIAFDNNGNAIAVWQQYDGSTVLQIYYARYDANTIAWSTPATIPGQLPQDGSSPQIAFDNNGNAIAVWIQSNGSNQQIYYARYDANTIAWSTPATIPSQLPHDGSSPQIAFDNNGNAIAVWYQSNGSINRIDYARYDANTTAWSDAAVIPGQAAQDGYEPQIAFDNTGNAIAVWIQSDGFNDQIYYARYDAARSQLIPPTITSARQNIHRFPTQADYVNHLAWEPVTGIATLASYNIYCKPYKSTAEYSVIGNVATSEPTHFNHHNRKPHQRLRYTITSVNSQGYESAPTSSVTIPSHL